MEGMFLYGDLPYETANGTEYVTSDNGAYKLYIRDQVGIFRDTDPASFSPNPSSGTQTPKSAMAYGDQNSGWCLIKYPIYRSDDAGKIEIGLCFDPFSGNLLLFGRNSFLSG